MDEVMLNDLLECSVCLERLDTSSKVLPCQHTFCKKCLEEIVITHHELRCPECRVLVNVKVEDLPPNVLLMRILEGMKNAIPKSNKTLSRNNNTSQRLIGGYQVAPISSAVISNPSVAIVTSESAQQNISKQIQFYNRPYGRAIYDYISKVSGDLNFKKGDIIILKKKIDNNWYLGKCGANHGVFPLSYVQVITPLPPHVPQCKALYDFKMMNDEEDGCLTFNKGELISVIRRVDENWAEGKLLDRIGIFPLAFVELNSVARALMKLSTNVQSGPSKIAPPTPTNEDTTPLIPTNYTPTVPISSQSGQVTSGTVLTDYQSGTNISMTSLTTNSSPITSSPNSNNSTTTPSSPSNSVVSSTVASTHGVKRHSFTGVKSAHQLNSQQWHSAEILNLAVDAALANTEDEINDSASSLNQSTSNTGDQNSHECNTNNDLMISQSSMSNSGSLNPAVITANDNTKITTSVNPVNKLPFTYIALYPYKPQKSDELELRKGGIYVVTEKCQDGWFKGTSNRTKKCGVFPGNYVVPAISQRTVFRCSKTISAQRSTSPITQIGNVDSRTSLNYTKTKCAAPLSYNIGKLLPPKLPPRALNPGPTGMSFRHNQKQIPIHNSPKLIDQAVSSPSISGKHNPGISTIFHSPGKLPITTTVVTNTSIETSTAFTNNSNKSPSSCQTTPSSSAGSTSALTLKPLEKVKEKKEKAVSLMRRLTNIKKSKSPPPLTYSMDNPVFEDGSTSQSLLINPIHVRSGSCPSQLLQLEAAQDMNVSTNSHHRMFLGQGHVTTSQRIKYKNRPSLPINFLQRFESGCNVTATTSHRKSNSLDAGTGKQTTQQISTKDRERVYRFRCIVPYPPNSEFELELRIGDIIYVHKKRDDGWYKGTQQRTGRTGLFPASFVEAF